MRVSILAGASALALAASACGTPVKTQPEASSSAEAPIANVTTRTPSIDPSDRTALFGDLHVHTGQSFDAFISSVHATPDDAYRYAKGEKLLTDGGYEIQLDSPLDFLAVTDHGEYLGIMPVMATPGTNLSRTNFAKSVFGPDATNPAQSFHNVGITIVTGEEVEEIYDRE
ncbi:MAG: DUF3604 domain-containing protein, partial [Hyphomonas sp.]